MCFYYVFAELLLYKTIPVQVNMCRYSFDWSWFVYSLFLFGPHCVLPLFVSPPTERVILLLFVKAFSSEIKPELHHVQQSSAAKQISLLFPYTWPRFKLKGPVWCFSICFLSENPMCMSAARLFLPRT